MASSRSRTAFGFACPVRSPPKRHNLVSNAFPGKRNDDEDAKEKLYTLATVVPDIKKPADFRVRLVVSLISAVNLAAGSVDASGRHRRVDGAFLLCRAALRF
jgi:hypothetical protein